MYLVLITNANGWWTEEYPMLFQTEEEALKFVTDMCDIIKAENIRFIEEILPVRMTWKDFDSSEYTPYLFMDEGGFYFAEPNISAISMRPDVLYMRKGKDKVSYTEYSIPIVGSTLTKYFSIMPIEIEGDV